MTVEEVDCLYQQQYQQSNDATSEKNHSNSCSDSKLRSDRKYDAASSRTITVSSYEGSDLSTSFVGEKEDQRCDLEYVLAEIR